MSIKLSEEAFTLLYLLRERLDRAVDLLDTDPATAKQRLSEVSAELLDLIGPGVP